MYAAQESIRDLLKDTEKEPVFIQGPDDLTGVLMSVETYELLGRFDESAEAERHERYDEELIYQRGHQDA